MFGVGSHFNDLSLERKENECVCFYFANLEPLIQCLGSFFPAHFQIKSGIVCVFVYVFELWLWISLCLYVH